MSICEFQYLTLEVFPLLFSSYVDNHRLCCLDDHIPGDCVEVTPQSPLFHCGSLLQNALIRLLFWIAGFMVLITNFFLLLWKTNRLWKDTAEKPHRVQNIFVWNLGVANILMGFYIVIVCSAELYYGEEFYIYSEEWWVSFPCRLAGFLSLLSAEASVFFIMLISIDVYNRIKYMDIEKRMDVKTAIKAAIAAWIVAGIIALTGALAASPNSEFYYLSDVCIGLPLIRRPSDFVIHEGDATSPFGDGNISINVPTSTKSAWVLSIFLFMVLNIICFIVSIVLYAQHSDRVATLRAQWKKEEKEQREREEEERKREMEEVENAFEEDGDDGIDRDKDDDMAKEQGEQDAPVEDIKGEVDIEKGQPVKDANIPRSDTKKVKRQSVKKSKKRLSIMRKKTKQKVKRTDNAEVKTRESAKMAPVKEDEEGVEENDATVGEAGASGKDSDTEADRHSETESKKQDDENQSNHDDKSIDFSVAGSEHDPYDKQTCRMYRKMKRVLYWAMFCWLPLFIMGSLSQCGLEIPVIAYPYTAAVVLPAAAYITSMVVMFSTCGCFEGSEIPAYIVNSEGEIQPVTDFDVYQQTWAALEI